MAAKSPRDRWVVCTEFALGPLTQAAAERAATPVHCAADHEIVISDTRPVTEADRARAAREAEQAAEYAEVPTRAWAI